MLEKFNEVLSSSSTASWGAEHFNLHNHNVMRFTFVQFEKNTDWHNCSSYEIKLTSIADAVKQFSKHINSEGNSRYEQFKKEIFDFLNYVPEYKMENQFNTPTSPHDLNLIAQKSLLISLFNQTPWKSLGIIESLKENLKNNSAHLVFSTFLNNGINENDYFVSAPKNNTYDLLKSTDKFGVISEDIFSNSAFTYSDSFT